ncbi:AT hook domain-containing protein [Apiospora arundinis]|uniref:AT hook domain-containing protein n=1 Tax=Apiospora arundinis TaxID=335852 RepID=A0ABR2II40_9PEZI
MATRRVIADSDEEEDDDFDSPLKPGPTAVPPAHRYDVDVEAEAPEMEPLSPVHQIGDALLHNHEYDQQQQQQRTSGSTDTTFFDNIHDEHRRMAQAQQQQQQQQQHQQRSSLIENIVRMSQKASTSSSGDTVSLPPKTAGGQAAKSSNVSSATDVTSPAVKLANKAKQKGTAVTTLSGKQVSSASEVTTPRKSDGKDEWDVPSSGDEGRANKSASRAAGGSATKTYGKRKRGSISKASASVPDFYAGPEELEVAEVARSSSDRLPVAKKGKMVEIASDESIIPDTGKFYIAPSSLTASQKEQYRRVHVSSSDENDRERGGEEDVTAPDYSMAPPPASKPKSSCATTIAYSTPSRYASSGPRPPWELAQPALDDDGEIIGVEDNQGGPEITENIVDLTSSPDIITSAHSKRRDQPTSTGKVPKLPRQLSRVDEEGVKPIGWSPSPKRRQKPSMRSDDDDELAGDDGWDSEDVGFHREVYKPRPSRRRTNGGGANAGNDARAAEDTTHDDVMQDLPPTQDPRQQQLPETKEVGRSEEIQETPDITKAPAVMVDDNPKPPPKKRGRKKKQPPPPEETSDELAQAQTASVSLGAGSGAAEQEPTMESAAAVEPDADGDYAPVEQAPKKKRGRPRKSDTPAKKAPESASIRTERNTLPSTADPLAMDEEDFAPEAAAANKTSTRDSSSLSDVPPSDEDDDDEDEEIMPVKRGRKKGVKRPKLSEPNDEAAAATASGSGSASPLKEVDRNTKLQSPAAATATATAEASEPESIATAKKPAAAAASSTPAKTPNPATPSQQQPGKMGYRVGLSKKSRVTSLLKIIRK